MALDFDLHVYTGTTDQLIINPEIGTSISNWNLTNNNIYDDSGSEYESEDSKLRIPNSGNNYSMERWIRGRFSGTGSSASNVKIYLSSGSLSDANLVLSGGETSSFITPVNSVSSIATNVSDDWDVVGEAIDITPAGGITSFPAWTDFFVIQLKIPSTVATLGNIGSLVLTVSYDET